MRIVPLPVSHDDAQRQPPSAQRKHAVLLIPPAAKRDTDHNDARPTATTPGWTAMTPAYSPAKARVAESAGHRRLT
jgi:hypothetical protein